MSILPEYQVEIDVQPATPAWILDVSRLSVDTVLQPNFAGGATWTAVPNVLSFQIARGRQDELGVMQPGTATVVLDNDDGRYLPANPLSPYYPNILPRRNLRISARWNGGPWIYLFTGTVNSWKPTDDGSLDAIMTVQSSDWMGRGPRNLITATLAATTEGGRIADLIAAIGLGIYVAAIDGDGTDTLLAKTLTSADGVQEILNTCTATRGNFFVSRDGTLTYQTRYHRWKSPGPFAASYIFAPPSVTNLAGLTPVPFLPGQPDYDLDDRYLYNEVVVTAPGVNESADVFDTASQTAYGKQVLTINSDVMDAGKAAAYATTLLAAYKDPKARVHALGLLAEYSPDDPHTAFWNVLWALELGNVVRLIKPASNIDQTMIVEGIAHQWSRAAGHQITLQLSDVNQLGQQPWILGASRLAYDTRLAY